MDGSDGRSCHPQLLTRKLAEAILAEIMALPDFEPEFFYKFRDEWSQPTARKFGNDRVLDA